jgi:SHS2 domain-containing protein
VGNYEILEHTADVGVEARGGTLEECFEQATLGLLEILGMQPAGRGTIVTLELVAEDLGGLLVDWLNEVLYLQDARDAVITALGVEKVTTRNATGWVSLAPRRGRHLEGTQVKATTYHQLMVDATPDGYVARVFFDV